MDLFLWDFFIFFFHMFRAVEVLMLEKKWYLIFKYELKFNPGVMSTFGLLLKVVEEMTSV